MKICVIIPVLNEVAHIGTLVASLRQKNWDVLVIDDGSTDGSGAIAKSKGAVVITHEKRQGKGATLRDGFSYALEHDFDGIITMDGDGQHDVLDLPKFLDKAGGTKNCVVSGNRMTAHHGMPAVRVFVNQLMSFLISCLCRQRIPDSQCGFRFIGSEVLRNIHLSCANYEIETEVLIKASKKNFPIFSVPVKTIYQDESSKIRPVRDTFRFFSYIFREAFNREP